MALVNASGTLLAKSPGGSVIESVVETDPKIRVKVHVYKDTPYDNVDYPDQKRQLWFRAGQVIRQSEWNAEFPLPTVTSITPATGPAAGSTTITIVGTEFTTGTTVTVDGDPATNITVINPTKLTCKTPAGEAGAVDVVVTTAAGSATVEDGFTYTA